MGATKKKRKEGKLLPPHQNDECARFSQPTQKTYLLEIPALDEADGGENGVEAQSPVLTFPQPRQLVILPLQPVHTQFHNTLDQTQQA